MSSPISARRVATLVGDFDRSPAYLGLADALWLRIADARIPVGSRLPSERELTETLGVSRTTVTRAYTSLVERGYAEARRGAGTFACMPLGQTQTSDPSLLCAESHPTAIDLTCAAPTSPPGIAEAYQAAVTDLPAYLSGHGYYPAGVPRLQQAIAATYGVRGLPTAPDQIMVTSGGQQSVAIIARAFSGPGQRVMVETPAYPNATQALRNHGGRLVPTPVDPDGWDLDQVGRTLRRHSPALAYLIPDFQNPTGNLMSKEQRAEYAEHLHRSQTVAIVDEALVDLPLEGQQMPRPFASFARDALTVGSASKGFWGGIGIGWIRAPQAAMKRLIQARITLDLGAPVFEQLVMTRLLADPEPVLAATRARVREQRDVLADALRQQLPDWRFRLPSGGLALWCELPTDAAHALALEAERRGVILAPGPVFASAGGLSNYMRLPFARSVDDLRAAVDRLAEAWQLVATQGLSRRSNSRVLVA